MLKKESTLPSVAPVESEVPLEELGQHSPMKFDRMEPVHNQIISADDIGKYTVLQELSA